MGIVSKEEFGEIIEAIHQICLFGWDHWRIWRQMHDFAVTDNESANYSPAFYQMTMEAHQNCAILSVYKLFDTDRRSFNMLKLLDLVSSNLNLFDFAKYGIIVDDELQNHRAQLEEIKRHANKVIVWRHKKVAHFDIEYMKSNGKMLDELSFTVGDFEEILQVSHSIMNAYSTYALDYSYALGSINNDDFETLMQYAMKGHNAFVEDIEKSRR